jgi:tRNA threonylcarbamoyladenosine biosynthesis protein TsaB
MIILSIRTDKPEAEIGLFDGHTKLACEAWQAHRQLAEMIHAKIDALLQSQNKAWPDVQGIVCFKGPGSFTGLRIGLTVANALSQSLSIPVITGQGDAWIQDGINRLLKDGNEHIALPEYGSPARTTAPRK